MKFTDQRETISLKKKKNTEIKNKSQNSNISMYPMTEDGRNDEKIKMRIGRGI